MRAIVEDDPPPRRLDSELDAIRPHGARKNSRLALSVSGPLADDIGRYLRGWPVLAKGNGAAYRLGKFAAPPVATFERCRAADRGLFCRHFRYATPGASCRAGARARATSKNPSRSKIKSTANQQRRLAEARTLEAGIRARERTRALPAGSFALRIAPVRSSRRHPRSGGIVHRAPADCRLKHSGNLSC